MAKQEVYWYTLADSNANIEQLQDNIYCDVIVIGGGVAGLVCAQRLASEGASVVILERDFVGSGASGKSSGFITPDSELELSDLYDEYGAESAKQLWEFAISGVLSIRNNILKRDFQCHYRIQDSLFIAKSEDGYKTVQHEHEIRQKLGYKSMLYNEAGLHDIIGSRGYYGGVRYGETFGITSFLYCQELKKYLQKKGVRIYERTAALNISDGLVATARGTVVAKKIVVCSDHWLGELANEGREVYHAQTFLGITYPLTDELVRYMFPQSEFMVWDTELIYQYFRIIPGNRLLMGGSNLLYTYEPRASWNLPVVRRKLQKYMRVNFPLLEKIEFEYFWPGLIGVSKDFLPVAGVSSTNPNIMYVSAAAGLPWAAGLGRYMADKIMNGRNDLDHYFSAKREFVIGQGAQSILRKPITFALSHAYEKFVK